MPKPFRQPPLALEGIPEMRFKILTDEHPSYVLAAFAYHLHRCIQEDDTAVRGLLAVLVKLWPHEKGDRKELYDDHVAAAVSRMDVGADEIAAVWELKRDSAQRKVRRGLARQVPDPDYDPVTDKHTIRWQIRAITGEEARLLLDDENAEILEAPLDPGTEEALGAALSAAPDPDEVAKARERMNRAFGLHYFGTVDPFSH
jgi:hypothetical protein